MIEVVLCLVLNKVILNKPVKHTLIKRERAGGDSALPSN